MNWSSWNVNTVTRRGVVVAAAASATALLIGSKPVSVTPATLDPNRVFPDQSFLITPDQLSDLIAGADSRINLLDASSLASFQSRHIAGARGVWWQDTMELNSVFYGTVLKPDDDQSQTRRQDLVTKWGLQTEGSTVVYDDTDSQAASRVAWFLRFVGIDAVALDGGLAAWLAFGGETTATVDAIPVDGIVTVAPQADYYFFAEQIATRVAEGSWRVVDLRQIEEQTAGPYARFTIPDAVIMPRSLFEAPGGGIREPQSLAVLLANAGINPHDQMILMGPTGMDARFPWLALRAMGAIKVAIADGGWQEWVTIPGVPLESLA